MATSPGGFVPGDVLGADDMNALPGGVLAYAQRTDTQGVTLPTGTNPPSSPSDWANISDLSVTFTAQAARRYRVAARLSRGSGSNRRLAVREGTTILFQRSISGHDHAEFCTVASISGEKTWNVAYFATGSGTDTVGGASDEPAFLMVEDVGPLPS